MRSEVYLENIKTDFENHLVAIGMIHDMLETSKDCTKYLADYINGDLEVLDTFKLIKSINRAAYIINFKIQNPTWDEIISAGDLRLIKSKELKSQITYFQGEYEIMNELEERKFNPVFIEFLNYSSIFFDVSNNFKSTSQSINFSKEGIWVDLDGLYKNDKIAVLVRKVFRAANEHQDFLISILKVECERILEKLTRELAKSK